MLQRTQPPAQLSKIRFPMLVRERVDDVFNFRHSLLQRFKEQEPRRQTINVSRQDKFLTSLNLVA